MATALDAFYPFNGQTLSNANWQNYLLMFSEDGVTQRLNSTTPLKVTERGGAATMSVDVAAGRILLQGIFGENSTTKNLAIAANSSGNARIDTVVVRLTQATPIVELDVLTGTPAGSPVAPALTQTASVYEVALANVAVANGAASIVNANITDLRAWAAAHFTRAPSTASATALPYPNYTSSVSMVSLPVSGTTTITSIPAAPAGSALQLDFTSAGCQVTSGGGTLTLSRNYVSSARGTLTLMSDGTTWTELSRSGERQAANLILAGPASGAAALANYRAIVAADLPVFTTWVPTINQSGALTFTTNFARTVQFGKFAMISMNVAFTNAGTGGNAIYVTLPAALTLAAAQAALGSFVFNDVSVVIYAGSVFFSTATTIVFVPGYAAITNYLGVTPNFAVASGDTLSFMICVELA